MWIVRGRRTTQRSRRLRAYWIAAAASLLACATLQVLAISANSDRIAEARKLLRAGDYARVESTARALIEEAGSTGGAGPDSVEAARGIDLLVTALVRAGRSREPGTGELAQRAVAIKERELGPDHPELAVSLFGLAEQQRMTGAYPEARAAYERSLAIRESAPDVSPAALVESLRGLANFQYRIGEYAEARSLEQRALAIAESSLGRDDPDVALVLVDTARLLRTTGDYAGGLPLLDRALEIQEKSVGPDHLETAYTLRELGEVLRLAGNYGAARPAFERSLAIRERALGPDHLEVADTLSGMGTYLRRVGIIKTRVASEAVPVCERALAIAEKTLGPDHPELAPYLEGLGWAVFQQGGGPWPGNVEIARKYFEKSLAVWDRSLGPGHLMSADSIEGLAYTTRTLAGRGDGAGGKEEQLGRVEASVEWSRKKLAIERAALGPDNIEVGFSLAQMAYSLEAQYLIVPQTPALRAQLLSELVDTALEAERINREHARATGRSLDENEALYVASIRWKHGLDLAVHHALVDGDGEVRRKTWDAVVRSRALVLDTMASRHGVALHATDPDLEVLAAAVRSARARLASLTVRGTGRGDQPAGRQPLENALRDVQRAERAFAARSASLAKEHERSGIGINDVIAQLPASGALVAYATFDFGVFQYAAFVWRAGEPSPKVVGLGSIEEIDLAVNSWRRTLSTPPGMDSDEEIARVAGAALRQKVWDPLAKHLNGVSRVFIVPDGSLNTVNFAALPSGRNEYLVENGPILHYLSSERDLVPPQARTPGKGMLAVGGPAFDDVSSFASLESGSATLIAATSKKTGSSKTAALPLISDAPYRGPRSSCESFQRMRFTPLPESLKETRHVAELWNRGIRSPAGTEKTTEKGTEGGSEAARQLVGGVASEAAFKRLAPGRRVLHIATHGFFLGGACASALDQSELGGGASRITSESPLLLSGLALAGANHRAAAAPDEEDGILTAEEIAALDLSSVEWAVLSACETASGDVQTGEGVLGLQRAFRIAGARTLIMSLWPVDDRATRQWMEALYNGHLQRGLDTAAAVRAATLSTLADRRRKGLDTHPFHWAAFIAAGDWH